jgi:hypothetical protein
MPISNKKIRIIWGIIFAIFMVTFYVTAIFGIDILPVTYDGDYILRED